MRLGDSVAAFGDADTTATRVMRQPLKVTNLPYASTQEDLDLLEREVYCVLGIPIDKVGLSEVLHRIVAAAALKKPCLMSTPNLDFLVLSQSNPEFRESLLRSDLCSADGMPIVWIARLLGLPITKRIAGSDIFEALKARTQNSSPLTVFLFGGDEGVAARAGEMLNEEICGLKCVGFANPGFGSVDDMSGREIINTVNASQADFLVVALGAAKGQAWLLRNHDRFHIPVRAHLGATLNFQAGSIKRAPPMWRKLGFEWAWRIKEEPYLWRRYWYDAKVLLRLLVTRVAPLMILNIWVSVSSREQCLSIVRLDASEAVVLKLSGAAVTQNVEKTISSLRGSMTARSANVSLDLSETRFIDARFIGLLFAFRRELKSRGKQLRLIELSPWMKRLFRLHGAEFLLFEPESV